jgi:hypothetical protein
MYSNTSKITNTKILDLDLRMKKLNLGKTSKREQSVKTVNTVKITKKKNLKKQARPKCTTYAGDGNGFTFNEATNDLYYDLILTRGLYPKDEVIYKLEQCYEYDPQKKNLTQSEKLNELYFWLNELYCSGYYRETWRTLLNMYYCYIHPREEVYPERSVYKIFMEWCKSLSIETTNFDYTTELSLYYVMEYCSPIAENTNTHDFTEIMNNSFHQVAIFAKNIYLKRNTYANYQIYKSVFWEYISTQSTEKSSFGLRGKIPAIYNTGILKNSYVITWIRYIEKLYKEYKTVQKTQQNLSSLTSTIEEILQKIGKCIQILIIEYDLLQSEELQEEITAALRLFMEKNKLNKTTSEDKPKVKTKIISLINILNNSMKFKSFNKSKYSEPFMDTEIIPDSYTESCISISENNNNPHEAPIEIILFITQLQNTIKDIAQTQSQQQPKKRIITYLLKDEEKEQIDIFSIPIEQLDCHERFRYREKHPEKYSIQKMNIQETINTVRNNYGITIKELQEIHWYNWELFAYQTPYWKLRLDKYDARVVQIKSKKDETFKRKLQFPDDDKFEEFYEIFGYNME